MVRVLKTQSVQSIGYILIPENLSEKMYDAIFSFKEKYAMFHSDADNLSQLLISVKIS